MTIADDRAAGDRFLWLAHGLWAAVMAAVVAVWWRMYGGFQVGTYMDDAKYIILARSLAAGGPYGLAIGPGTPPTTGYPFLFPLMLAPLVSRWPTDFDRLTAVSLVATLASATLVYWGWPLLSRTRSRWWGLAVGALYALSPLTLGHAGMVMPEPVFTAFAWGALILVEYVARRGAGGTGPMVALGFLCTAAMFTRSVGLALWLPIAVRIVTTIGLSLRRAMALGVGVLVVLLPAVGLSPVTVANLCPAKYLATLQQPHEAAYDPVERNVLTRITRGLGMYGGGMLREAIVPLGGGDRERAVWNRFGLAALSPVTSVVVAGVIALGIIAAPRPNKLSSPVVSFELLYLSILMLWPYRASRFLYPIVPFLIFQFLVGVRLVVQWLLARVVADRAPRLAQAVVALAVAVLAIMPAHRFASVQPSTAFAPDYRTVAAWVRTHTPSDAVVLVNEWESMALYAERQIVPAAQIGSAAAITDAVQHKEVSYVVIVPESVWRADGQRQYGLFTRETLLPLVDTLQQEGLVRPVYESDAREMVKIYQVEPGRADAGTGKPFRR